jgi:hypothetical protein
VTKRKQSPSRIPKARRVQRSALNRADVTRGEYNRIIDVLNERNVILNGLRDALQRVEQENAIQFKRIAQLQAELDEVTRTLQRQKPAVT